VSTELIGALAGIGGVIGLLLWSHFRTRKQTRLEERVKAQDETIENQEARIEAVSENANRSDDALSDRLSNLERNTDD